MKRLFVALVACGFVVGMSSPAMAIKPFNDQFIKTYVEKSDNEGFKTAVKEAKCGLCHLEGDKKDPKNRNAYAAEVGKLLKAKEVGPLVKSDQPRPQPSSKKRSRRSKQ